MAPKKDARKAKSQSLSASTTIFFHKEWEDHGYMSNYYLASFVAPNPAQWLPVASDDIVKANYTDPTQTVTFRCSEQYYMYCKALQFEDGDTAAQILAAKEGADCKALGKEVKGFKDDIWNQVKLGVMEEALWWKFGGGGREQQAGGSELSEMGRRLLATGSQRPVEAAGRDREWGIGYGMKQQPEKYEQYWGNNYLGKTLMRVRDRLRALEDSIRSGEFWLSASQPDG
jgi:ribA/ribD-fused uncharacterized protein